MAINPTGATANPGKAVFYDQSENTIRFHFGTTNPASDNIAANSKVRLIGQFYANTTDNTNGEFINGREFTVTSVGSETVGGNAQYYIECSTAGMNLPDSDFTVSILRQEMMQIFTVLFQLLLRPSLKDLTLQQFIKERMLTLVTKNLF